MDQARDQAREHTTAQASEAANDPARNAGFDLGQVSHAEAVSHTETVSAPPLKGLVELDRERCRGCLLCLDICPNELFVRDERPNASGALPALMRTPEYCLNCMRCVSICPDQAFDVPVNPAFNLAAHVFGLSLRLHRLAGPPKDKLS
ncbi:MAG: hypothetical protein CVV27_14765 [Candidatus Melainabacteria bacterium HGW-Melainabacteria-1]|nr:MAG: hypothetical protein CVV27_14765 [Candidatus Melainabacteria bacterium HGW-Melainabacteria-1]